MVLSRPHAKFAVYKRAAWLQASRERLRDTDSLSKEVRLLRYLVSWGKPALGKRGRRGVCRLMHKGRVVGRSPTFENLPKRKQAGLKVRRGGWAIRCVLLRCKGYMGMNLRNQVLQIALRFDCRWIGQPVERCPNDQHAQQTYRNLGSQSLIALCPYPSGKSVACGHWLHPLRTMQQTLSEIACDREGINVQRNSNQPRTLAAAEVAIRSGTSEERRAKSNLARPLRTRRG